MRFFGGFSNDNKSLLKRGLYGTVRLFLVLCVGPPARLLYIFVALVIGHKRYDDCGGSGSGGDNGDDMVVAMMMSTRSFHAQAAESQHEYIEIENLVLVQTLAGKVCSAALLFHLYRCGFR